MAKPIHRPDDDDIADVNSYFDDSPQPASGPSPKKAIPLGESYDVEGEEPPDEIAPVLPVPVIPPRKKKPKPKPSGDAGVDEEDSRPRAPVVEGRVDEVWTRMGEWGPTLLLLVIVAAAVVGIAYLAFSSGSLLTGFLILVVGGSLFVLLSYPIAVTMERPVRMTPEQAVKDYYAAASHHFPHYRRMWLLLSADGKVSGEFDSLATFQAYWKKRMKELRGSRVKSSVPLAFEIGDFRSEKSAGKTSLEAKYTVNVRPRGESADTLVNVRIVTSLVRGPDKMWYLNSGVLPRPEPEGRKDAAGETSWDV